MSKDGAERRTNDKKQDIANEIDFLQRYLNRTYDELNDLKKKIPEGCRVH